MRPHDASQHLPCYQTFLGIPKKLWLTSYHHHHHRQAHHHHHCRLGADGASELNELLANISQTLDGGSVGVNQLQQDLQILTFNSDSDFNYGFFEITSASQLQLYFNLHDVHPEV